MSTREARASPGGILKALSDLLERNSLLRRAKGDPGRDMNTVLSRKGEVTYEDFRRRYDRTGIAQRIIKAYPEATWRVMPQVFEDEDNENETPFEAAWAALEREKRILSFLTRTDTLANLGRYAILLIGVPGSSDLKEPLTAGSAGELLFLAPYSEGDATIETFDVDPTSPRFGLPELYKVDLAGSLEGKTSIAAAQLVHHTRVIHVAEGLLDDEVYGTPRLKAIWDDLDDIAKVVGGSAEMFWQGADRAMHMDIKEGLRFGTDEKAALEKELAEFYDGLRRVIRTQGVELDPLPSVTPDPSSTSSVLFDLVSGATGIPKRILLGSERGELASSQDRDNWADRVAERQVNYSEYTILRPLIDRLIWLGILPAADYGITWPDLTAPTAKDRAEVARSVATAVRAFAGHAGNTEKIMTTAEFREAVLGLAPDLPYEKEGDDADET